MKKQFFLITAAIALIGGAIGLLNHPSDAATSDPIALAVHPDGQLPYLLTADGQLLEADASGIWQSIGPPALVEDVLYESTGHVWAASASGLFLRQGNSWQLIDSTPSHTLESTHGYLFAIGADGIIRLTESKNPKLGSLRLLTLPATPATDLVMLGTHTHVLHTGDQAFHTLDVGLSWMPLSAPEPIRRISTDADGRLIAATDTRVLRLSSNQWANFLPLPEDQPIQTMRVYAGNIYALVADALYEQSGSYWLKVSLPDSQNAEFTALEFEYPDTLWLLDSAGKRLYSTSDGKNWKIAPIKLEATTT